MATALIFAGGTGRRMNSSSKPKQFLEMHGKPIIIYTLEHFEHHIEVTNIVVVCISEWISRLEEMLKRYGITKVTKIVPGGKTGHDSIYNGLTALKDIVNDEEVILIHDGVRPLINEALISLNIEAAQKYGNAITAEPVKESVIRSKDGENVHEMPSRNQMYIAKAPQTFRYKEILNLYQMAKRDGIKSIDSAHLCSIYKKPMHMVASPPNNIKITEPADFYICRALHDIPESHQILEI